MKEAIIYIAKITWLLLVFYVFYRLFFRNLTFHALNRFYLLGTLVLAFVLPFWQGAEIIKGVAGGSFTLPEVSVGRLLGGEVAGTGLAAHLSGGLTFIITLIYLMVTAGLLGRLLWGILSTLALRSRSRRFEHKGISIYIAPGPIQAFSFGRAIFMSKDHWEKDGMQAVLRHELTHIRQLHSLDVWITEVLCALFWFHPLVWLYRRSLREVHEFLADSSVLEKGQDPVQYLAILMDSSCRTALSIVNNPFNHSLLKRRFAMILKNKTGKRGIFLVAVTVPVLMGISFISLGMLSFHGDYPVMPQKVMLSVQHPVVAWQEQDQDKVFDKVETMPEYPGGFQALSQYLVSSVKYPEMAKKLGLESTVYVQFVVDNTGAVSKAKVLKVNGVDLKKGSKVSKEDYKKGMNLMGEEALRVINSIPLKWKPGQDKGKAVKVAMTLPIKFRLG